MLSFSDSCGSLIEVKDTVGTVSTPSFPDKYPNNIECVWELVAPVNRQVFLNFTHFQLEGGTLHLDCNYDNVTVFSQMDDNFKRMGTFCGSTKPPLIVSDKNILRIEFHSDKSIEHAGFSAIYFTGKHNPIPKCLVFELNYFVSCSHYRCGRMCN